MILVENNTNSHLLPSLSVAAPIVLTAHQFLDGVKVNSAWVKCEYDYENILKVLDSGADVAILNFKEISRFTTRELQETLENIPAMRMCLEFTPDPNQPDKGPNFGALSFVFKYFIICEPLSVDIMLTLKLNFPDCEFILKTSKNILQCFEKGIDICVDISELSLSLEENADKLDFVRLFLARSKSDRPDGLFSTLVTDRQGVCLGLCYSSIESLKHALLSMAGIYWSRTRGLWFKGKTSGATQKLIKMGLDCDGDAIRFVVEQQQPGFCHLNTRTCFGADTGITALYSTLESRMMDAVQGSYTKRLFSDKQLLDSKIIEEAQELVSADTKQDVAWEAADLLYFAFVKCVKEGVNLSDIEMQLDARSKKITRRPGNAKVPLQQNAKEIKSIVVETKQVSNDLPDYHMRVYKHGEHDQKTLDSLLIRPILDTTEILNRVKPIMSDVRARGDEAIKEFTKKFDGVDLKEVIIKAPFASNLMQIDQKVKDSIDLACHNVEKFHVAQLQEPTLVVETMPGVTCSRFIRPIEKVGLYVPGGTAILPSSTMMLGIPAKAAGCSEIVIATPPRKDGTIAPEVVYVAQKVGASMIVKAGGAQAVAAMAYGTETVTKVDKICGPGNQYVTQAKMLAQSDHSALLSIDMPAGPSELLVIADISADNRYVVSDLLSQAEHGIDSQVVLLAVGLSDLDIDKLQKEIVNQASVLPRSDIVKVSLSKSYILQLETIDAAVQFSNKYAPEHLILNVLDPEALLPKIKNAGSVFVGPWSPESCGDYASGTNHTLPTYGYARMYSGVNSHTFVKHITAQTITKQGLNAMGDAVVTLAEVEGLEAHRNAVAIRLKDIRQ